MRVLDPVEAELMRADACLGGIRFDNAPSSRALPPAAQGPDYHEVLTNHMMPIAAPAIAMPTVTKRVTLTARGLRIARE